MSSIRKFIIQCKFRLRILKDREDVFVVLLILFVGFGGFGLGRLSALKETKEPISIAGGENNLATALGAPEVSTQEAAKNMLLSAPKKEGALVGSIQGTKYHLPNCPGATHIKEENKIWFTSIEEAKQAGYTPASNCKGL